MALVVAMFALVGCDTAKKPEEPVKITSESIVARIDGDRITLGEFEAELSRYGDLLKAGKKESDREKIRKSLLDRMINDTTLELEADRLGIKVTQRALEEKIKELLGAYDEARLGIVLAEKNISFDTWKENLARRIKIESLIEREVYSRVEASEDEIRKYYDKNFESFVWPERVRVRQIMARDETMAEQARKKLLKDDDFAKIAKEISQSPDAVDGGDLGFVSRGQLPPELEAVVFELKKGEISEVVKSIYGFHIFKVLEVEKSRPMTYEEASERIRKILIAPKREEAFKNWLSKLKERMSVTVYPEVLSARRS